jgi:tetratricopeptide (TPR) repeat protein
VLQTIEADPPGAVDAWTQAIRRNPRDANSWKARGLALAEQGEFDRAAGDFAEAQRLDPDPAIRYYRGVDYLRMGDPGMAIAEFTNALILDPGFLNALERRARAFRALNDQARAALDDREARRLRLMAHTRLVAEAGRQGSREVPLKTA